MKLTHYMLDGWVRLGQNKSVKVYPIAWFCLLLALATVGCKPQGTNIDKLNELQRRNAQLRQDIADMKNIIRRAGEDEPNLQEQIDARNKEVVQAYETLKALKAQETEVRMRRIELEGRLESFRESFRELQNRIVASVKNLQ